MKLIRIIFTMIGFIALAIGIVGSFVPILPTTPFVLIALFCFGKGSIRFHNWFCSTKIYKKHLCTFVTEHNMTLKTKLCILLPATCMIAAAFLLSPWLHLRIFLVVLLICKYIYFFTRIATVKNND